MCSLQEYAINQGIESAMITNLKSLMETLNLTLKEAMKALKLSEEDCINMKNY